MGLGRAGLEIGEPVANTARQVDRQSHASPRDAGIEGQTPSELIRKTEERAQSDYRRRGIQPIIGRTLKTLCVALL